MIPPAICVDFDATIATYAGWHNEGFVEITGEPIPGAKEAINAMRQWAVVYVHSVRCGYPGGVAAIQAWLERYNIVVDGVSVNKPRCDIYVDDKGLRFEGNWRETYGDIVKRTASC